MKTRYTFYKDFWPYLLGISIVISGCIPLVMIVLHKNSGSFVFPVIWMGIFFFAAIWWLRSYCEFKDDHLLVVTGPVTERFYYGSISGLKMTRGLALRGMAPAVRYALYYNRALRRYLNPMDCEGFLKQFAEKCPDAKLE